MTVVEMAPRLMIPEDVGFRPWWRTFCPRNLSMSWWDTWPKEFVVENGVNRMIAEHQGQDVSVEFDRVLVARRPR